MPRTSRPPQSTLDADRAALLDLQNLGDYAPRNAACTTAALLELEAALVRAEEAEARARWAADQARREADRAAQAFHISMLGAKDEVRAQYGRNSQALRAVGLTPRSERKRPTRRQAATRE